MLNSKKLYKKILDVIYAKTELNAAHSGRGWACA